MLWQEQKGIIYRDKYGILHTGAVGSKSFIETIKEKLGFHAKGRKIIENNGGFQLRENMKSYIADFDGKNGNIEAQNTYSWDANHEFTMV